jgi:hypothetical protein
MIYAQKLMLIIFCVFILGSGNLCHSAPFTVGNVVVSKGNALHEYTRAGDLVQQIAIPSTGLGSCSSCEYPRDVVVSSNGHAFVFNGTSGPALSEFRPSDSSWIHHTTPHWSISNDISSGGVTVFGKFVYVSNMEASIESGRPEGVIRFDLDTGSIVRFANDVRATDVNMGLDGLLYVLYPGGSPSGRTVRVYHPVSMDLLRTIDVGRDDHRGVAADFDGSIYLVAWGEQLKRLSPDGILLSTMAIPVQDTFDVDIAPDGAIIVGSRFGRAFLTDREFKKSRVLTFSGGGVFVGFVTNVPEPCTVLFAALVGFSLLGIRRR